jgi:hypothetical protein
VLARGWQEVDVHVREELSAQFGSIGQARPEPTQSRAPAYR